MIEESINPRRATGNVRYAVIAYLEGDLARFVEALRGALKPGDIARAHLTVLPPRPLSGSPHEALATLTRAATLVDPFEVFPEQVGVFEDTHVVKLSIGEGREHLLRLHAALNTGPLLWTEEREYVPHITLGFNVGDGNLPQCLAIARERWNSFGRTTPVQIRRLTLVREEPDESWTDLGTVELGGKGRN